MLSCSTKTVSEFIEYDLLSIPPTISQWLPVEQIHANLNIELAKNQHSMRDDIFAYGFKKLCPVEGTSADHYKFRILELKHNLKALTSIRFKCLDVTQPYVEILHKNFLIKSVDQIKQLASEIHQHYKIFAPKWIRLFDSSGILEQAVDDKTVICDLRLFAGLIEKLKLRPFPKTQEKVALEPARDMEIYSLYQELYGELYKENPALRSMLCKESPHTFQKIRDAGTLFNILIEGKWAGIIGLSEEYEKFLYGYRMVDQIISKPYRGKGFAVAVQRRLIEVIESKKNEVLFGQISPSNISSARTALRVGREDIGGWYFIKT